MSDDSDFDSCANRFPDPDRPDELSEIPVSDTIIM